MPLVELVTILALILLNGFFAMAEIAVVSARRARLQELARRGLKGAATALELVDAPTRFLSTVQIGITTIGILAGAYGGATLAEPLAEHLAGLGLGERAVQILALGLVVVPITYVSLTVGELVPKRIALANAELIAARIAAPMALIARLAAPLVWFLGVSVEATLRLLGIGRARPARVSAEEVRALIAEATESGLFHARARDMIDAVLHLADREAEGAMTPRRELVWLDLDDDADTVRRKIAACGHSRFPLRGRGPDELRGIVHTKDLLDRAMQGLPLDLAACARPPMVVHGGTSLLRLLEQFRREPVHLALVVDEHGTIAGVVSPVDILAAIAGDLASESEADDEPPVVQRADGSYLVDGRVGLDTVERLLGRGDMRTGHDHHTLAGFVLWRLGHLPQIGESFLWQGLRFEVVDMDGQRIDRVLIAREPG